MSNGKIVKLRELEVTRFFDEQSGIHLEEILRELVNSRIDKTVETYYNTNRINDTASPFKEVV